MTTSTEVPAWQIKAPYIEGEVWKDIPTERGSKLQASNLGRIRNKYNPSLIYSQKKTPTGYLQTSHDTYCTKVHRLVCAAFHEVPNIESNYMLAADGIPFQVHHINYHKDDNRPDNLRWETVQDHTHITVDDERLETNIRCMIYDTEEDIEYQFKSLKEASRALNVDSNTIGRYGLALSDQLLLDQYKVTILTPDKLGNHKNTGVNVEVLVKDFTIPNSQGVIYNSINHASMVTGVRLDKLKAAIERNDDKMISGYGFRKFSADNLGTWPSYSTDEAKHSRDMYLKSLYENVKLDSSRPIEVYDLETKVVDHKLSLRQAVQYYKDDEVFIRRIMTHDKLYVVNGHVYRWLGDTKPWESATPYKPIESYQAKNYTTSEIKRFERAGEVTEFFGDIPFNLIGKQTKSLKPGQTCRPVNGWFIKSEDRDDCSVWPEFTEQEVQDSLNYKRDPSFLAKNYQTGEIRRLEKASNVRELFGNRSPTEVMKYCYHPKFPIRALGGWLLKKEDDTTPWPDFVS